MAKKTIVSLIIISSFAVGGFFYFLKTSGVLPDNAFLASLVKFLSSGEEGEKTFSLTEEEFLSLKKRIAFLEDDLKTRKEELESLDDFAEKIETLSQKITELEAERQALADKISESQSEEEDAQEEESDEETNEAGQDIEQNLCQKTTGIQPLRNKVIINEIAWMGTINSANEEWIELKNISGQEINLSNWQLLDKDSQVKIIFNIQHRALNNGFLLLERMADEAVPGVKADLIYTGALSNTNEALYLFDNNCQLQDMIEADSSWPAGDNSSKRTMERKSDLVWQTSKDSGGTAKRENSGGYIVTSGDGGSGGNGGGAPPPAPTDDKTPSITFNLDSAQFSLNFTVNFEITDNSAENVNPSGLASYQLRWKAEGGDWQEDTIENIAASPVTYSASRDFIAPLDETKYYFQAKAKDINNNESDWLPEVPVSTQVRTPKTILINEVQIDSLEGAGGANDDWVELYNSYDVSVSLAGWSIQEHSKSDPCSIGAGFYQKSFLDDAIIPAKGFYLVVDTEAKDSLKNIADMTIRWSLTDNNTIYLVQNQDQIENGDDSDIIDKVGFGSSCFPEGNPAPNPPKAKSVERTGLGLDTNDNSLDFQINDAPAPINSRGETI